MCVRIKKYLVPGNCVESLRIMCNMKVVIILNTNISCFHSSDSTNCAVTPCNLVFRILHDSYSPFVFRRLRWKHQLHYESGMVRLHACTRMILGSNLRRDTDYSEFFAVFSGPSDKLRNSISVRPLPLLSESF
jgi:hypothetical protein